VEYLKEHDRAHPADISSDLEIEFAEVMKITTQLVKEGVLGVIEKEEE
jgi:hypothetical protein